MGPLYTYSRSYRKSFGTPIFCHPSLVWDLRLFIFKTTGSFLEDLSTTFFFKSYKLQTPNIDT